MRRTTSVLLLAFAFFSFSLFAQSQATAGVIEGTVTDATGAVLPGVTVSIRNAATNYVQPQVTDSAGRYHGVLLPLAAVQHQHPQLRREAP